MIVAYTHFVKESPLVHQQQHHIWHIHYDCAIPGPVPILMLHITSTWRLSFGMECNALNCCACLARRMEWPVFPPVNISLNIRQLQEH